MATSYSLVNGELRISGTAPPFEWRGQVDSIVVTGVVPLPDGSAALLLLDPPSGSTPVRNLVKCGADARIVWRGELPTELSGECYVSVHTDEFGDVRASSWSGYQVILAGATGRLLDRRFAK